LASHTGPYPKAAKVLFMVLMVLFMAANVLSTQGATC
jgi:hypothetical protein